MDDLSYELTEESKFTPDGVTVYRIRATRDIPRFGIKKGDLGGWVQSLRLDNGDARVSGNAWVYGNARVSGNAWVYGNARVSGNAQVSGNAWVYGNARVSGNALVYGNAQVSGNARVHERWHYLVVGPIGSENVTATIFHTKDGKHALNVGCWSGRLGTLMAEVKRRRASEDTWLDASPEQQEAWVAEYRALKALGKIAVARWSEVG